MKKTFKLVADITISAYTEVEANSLEEAILIAGDREVEIVNYDKFQSQRCWSAELDGSPENIRQE